MSIQSRFFHKKANNKKIFSLKTAKAVRLRKHLWQTTITMMAGTIKTKGKEMVFPTIPSSVQTEELRVPDLAET